MKLTTVLTTFALTLGATAAKKDSDRFTKQYAKPLPLKLTDTSFASLTRTPRDYSLAILLTAIEPRFGCQACQDFQPEWEVLGRSWQKGDKKGEGRVLMGTLDFLDGKGTFQQLGLQHAPILLYYGPGEEGPVRYDFTAGYVSPSPQSSWRYEY